MEFVCDLPCIQGEHHITIQPCHTPAFVQLQDRAKVLVEVQLPVASQEDEAVNTLAGLALFMAA